MKIKDLISPYKEMALVEQVAQGNEPKKLTKAEICKAFDCSTFKIID
jgi:hypothetical protein